MFDIRSVENETNADFEAIVEINRLLAPEE